MKEYKVYSDKLRLYLSQIEDDLLRERFKIFFSLHEHVHFQYSNNNNEPVQELRVAAEALCKLLIFVYVPNANSLFNNKDKLSHAYFKVWDKSLDDNLKIKEGPLNAAPTYGHKYDSTDLGQLASVLLCKKDEKEDGKNQIYNKIKECYNNLYAPLNTDASHPVPTAKQSFFYASTLFSY